MHAFIIRDLGSNGLSNHRNVCLSALNVNMKNNFTMEHNN